MKARRKVLQEVMTPFERAMIPQSEVERLKNLTDAEKVAGLPDGATVADFDALIDTMIASEAVYLNSLYQVTVREMDSGMTHLSIKRRDKRASRDWRHFQTIKNDLCGPEREAVELYPAESRLVDSANQYHLFVFPEGYQIPIGFQARYVRDESLWGAEQREQGEQTDE